ncbi:MAG TPA: FtsX-like permease family protein [Pseudonocardiaceae bacterium]|nr:FtsX-like permease family protein [Pseudonocardiaceae bacterium]
MTLIGLALRSIRYRPASFLASFVALLSGSVVLMTFASLLDTAAGPATRTTLIIMASVVGGWGLVIVAFTVSSTLALTLRQRGGDIALLKSIGATPRQLRGLIVGEAVAVATIAALAAIAPSVFAGRELIVLLKNTDQVPAQVSAGFGPFAIGIGFGITLLAAVVVAGSAAHRAANTATADAIRDAALDNPKPGRLRLIGGTSALAGGLSCAIVTATRLTGNGFALMGVGAQGSILAAIGFALLAPALLRRAGTALAPPLRRAGVGGYLTALALRARTQQLAGALVPIILFTAIATGTLYLQTVQNAATTAAEPEIARSIETLNYVVVGMIALFAALMLVNTLIAVTGDRKREFGQLRLIGSTPRQVLGTIGIEGVVLAGCGIVLGSIAALATVVPFSIGKTGAVLPNAPITIYLAVVGTAAVLTLAAGLGAARNAIRTPAVEAAAG